MHLFKREQVAKQLRLGERQSYRLLSSIRDGMISSDSLLEMLNHSRVGNQGFVTSVPNDLLTPEELANELEIMGMERAKAKIRSWSLFRTRDPIPHFRLNGHTRRYSRRSVWDWLTLQPRRIVDAITE